MKSAKSRSNRFDFPWKPLLVVLSIFILIALVLFRKHSYQQYLLERDGVQSVCMLAYNSSQEGNVTVRFKSAAEIFEYHTYLRFNDYHTEIITPNRMPLKTGDRFILTYLSDDPETYKVHYNQPTEPTLKRYLSITSHYQQQYFLRKEKEPFDMYFCRCMTTKVYGEFGLCGLANIRYNDTFFLLNIKSNSWRHYNMTRTDKYQEIWKSCNRHISNVQALRAKKSIYD